ncbi:hypothetical protein ABH941_008157 [Streptacidiphilus sp. EB103A]
MVSSRRPSAFSTSRLTWRRPGRSGSSWLKSTSSTGRAPLDEALWAPLSASGMVTRRAAPSTSTNTLPVHVTEAERNQSPVSAKSNPYPWVHCASWSDGEVRQGPPKEDGAGLKPVGLGRPAQPASRSHSIAQPVPRSRHSSLRISSTSSAVCSARRTCVGTLRHRAASAATGVHATAASHTAGASAPAPRIAPAATRSRNELRRANHLLHDLSRTGPDNSRSGRPRAHRSGLDQRRARRPTPASTPGHFKTSPSPVT